jgi:hypothetical protein
MTDEVPVLKVGDALLSCIYTSSYSRITITAVQAVLVLGRRADLYVLGRRADLLGRRADLLGRRLYWPVPVESHRAKSVADMTAPAEESEGWAEFHEKKRVFRQTTVITHLSNNSQSSLIADS